MPLYSTLRFITSHPLTRSKPLGALIRFFRWQLESRVLPNPIRKRWIEGTQFFARRGETGVTGNIYVGLDEFEDMAFSLHFLRPDDLFVDVGANSGSYSILACGAANAKVIAFEPISATFQRLQMNFTLNNFRDAAEAINIAIGSQNGLLDFTNTTDSVNHVLAKGEKPISKERIQVKTLDSVLCSRTPTLIKIDVEGFERPVIDGGTATLKDVSLHAVIIELNGSGARYGFHDDEIVKTMNSFGFATYQYEPFSRSFQEIDGKNKANVNTLFIRDLEFAKARVSGSRRYKVAGFEL